jgi:hypothetical protein
LWNTLSFAFYSLLLTKLKGHFNRYYAGSIDEENGARLPANARNE